MTVFLCENGFDGILTGVYEAYASKLPLEECGLSMETEYEPELFVEYRSVKRDGTKAGKVAAKIRSRMSEEAYAALYRASLYQGTERADWIFRFIRQGLRYGSGILRRLQDPAVYEIFRMDRAVGREAHAHKEFLRFAKTPGGCFYGTVGPENDVLELVADHFLDRFPDMDWVLYDEVRKKALFCSGGAGAWIIREGVEQKKLEDALYLREKDADRDLSVYGQEAKEDEYADLWRVFFGSIAIEERRNPRCQRNMLPLRYRKYMTEFTK